MHIIVIDEFDLMCEDKKVLYMLLHWSQPEWAPNLIIVGVGNRGNILQMMDPRCISRMGNKMVEFSPYQEQELVAIVTQRVYMFENLFKRGAINLIAKKVAV